MRNALYFSFVFALGLGLGTPSAAQAQDAAKTKAKTAPAKPAEKAKAAPAKEKKDAKKADKAAKPAAAAKAGDAKKDGAKKDGAEKKADKEGKAADKKDAKAEEKEAPAKKKKGKLQVTWLGHAAFKIVSPGGTTILIDPFLKNNPSTPADQKDPAAYTPDAILVTHGHADHLGDAVAISRKSGAPVIGGHDLVKSLKLKDNRKKGGNVGGMHTIGDVEVHIVPAMHSSAPGGRPVGFVLKFENKKTIYHSGDTWIFSDMKLINEIHKPNIVLMNCGGGPFTQNPKTCALATKKYFKKAKAIVPMHYGTFPPLAREEDVKKAFEKQKKKLKLLKPGESIEFK